MTTILKLLGTERSIGTANNVANSGLVRIVNTGATAVMNVAYANAVLYANATITNTEPVYLVKATTDLISGANMVAAPVAYRN